jgi:thioredoxin 1
VAWIDVEDHDDEMGEVEVETFPTMLLARGSEAVFLGPVPPSAPQLEHLVDRLSPAPALQGVAAALLARLQPLLDPARV